MGREKSIHNAILKDIERKLQMDVGKDVILNPT